MAQILTPLNILFWNLMRCRENWFKKRMFSNLFFPKNIILTNFYSSESLIIFSSIFRKARKCKLWSYHSVKWSRKHLFESKISNSFWSAKKNFTSKTSALWKMGLKIWRTVKGLIERLTRCRRLFQMLIKIKKVVEFHFCHKFCFKICFSKNVHFGIKIFKTARKS